MSGDVDISPPVTHNTFSAPVAVDRLTDKAIQVIGTAGGHTVEVHGSDDGTHYSVLTGSGVAGAEQLPTTGSIAADGFYQLPLSVGFVKTRKTDADDAAQVTILLQARRAPGV